MTQRSTVSPSKRLWILLPGTQRSTVSGFRSGGNPRGGGNARRPAPAEPATFEDRLKQFMQASDSKLSELRYMDRRGGSRRGGRK